MQNALVACVTGNDDYGRQTYSRKAGIETGSKHFHGSEGRMYSVTSQFNVVLLNNGCFAILHYPLRYYQARNVAQTQYRNNSRRMQIAVMEGKATIRSVKLYRDYSLIYTRNAIKAKIMELIWKM